MEAGDRISFQEIVEALKRRRRLLVALPVIFTAAIGALSLFQAREYKATAVLRVGLLRLQNVRLERSISGQRIRTAVKLIPSLVPAREVVRKFKLDAEPYNARADEFWDNIGLVKIVKGTELIEISAFTMNPRLSMDMANYIANQTVSRQMKHARSDAVRVREEVRKRLDGAKRRLDSAEYALLKFNQESRLGELRQDIRTLLAQREYLASMRFASLLNAQDTDRDALSKEKEEVLKLLGGDAEFPELKMAMDKNDGLLEHHRALSKKMLEMKSRLSAMLSAANGDSRVAALSGARRKSMESAGAGDVVRAASRLEKIRSEKKSLEDERKDLSTSLPALAVEIQVSMSRLKSLETMMSDFRNASRGGTLSADERTRSDAPRKNAGANSEKASDAALDAVSVKIVDEGLRLEGLKEKKKRHQERIAKIDAELPEVSGKLLELEARRLLLKISRTSGEIKKIESEILANRREIAERRGRRNSLLARLGALEEASAGVGKIEAPLFTASRSGRSRDFEGPEDGGSPERENFSPNILLNRLRILDKDILTAERLRHREKLFGARLKDVDRELGKKIREEAASLSLLEKVKLDHSLAKQTYADISGDYNQAVAAVLSSSTDLRIVSPAGLPEMPVSGRHLAIIASLSFVFGLLFAIFAALFLEFRQAILARKEPDGA